MKRPESLTTLAECAAKWDTYTNVRPPRHGLGVRGRGRTNQEFDVDILPPADLAVSTSPSVTFTERMATADGCPECVANVETPRSVVDTDNGFRAAYLCGHCGHAWTTDWREDA